MLRTFLMFIIIMLAFSTPAMGEELGIHGDLTLKHSQFSLMDDSNVRQSSNQLWKVDVYYRFSDWFSLGVNTICNTDGYELNYGIPSFTPVSQFYEVYLSFEPIKNVFIRGSQWCNHPTLNNTGLDKSLWQGGYSIELSYKF